MSIIKILVVPSDHYGSGKFRSIDPHINLDNNEFFVDINYTPDFGDTEYLKQYNIIHIHRYITSRFWETDKIIDGLQKLGIKVVFDIDDYWHVDTHHQSYRKTLEMKIPSHIISAARQSDMITVPTTLLADELKKSGVKNNIVVIPNCINPKEDQFIINPTKSEKLRFGYLGGSSHLKDLELLKGISNTNQNYQTVLCGYDIRGLVKNKDTETGEITERNVSPFETVWFQYELLMTGGFECVQNDKEYVDWLLKFKDENYTDLNKPYRRIFTRPISGYAKGYNEFDVSLAPLKDTKFNMFKSELKIIEAGFMKKALIASNYGPYTSDLIHGKNALLVDVNKNHKQWKKHIKTLVDNPNMVIDLSESLYETVKDKFSQITVNTLRSQQYKNLIND